MSCPFWLKTERCIHDIFFYLQYLITFRVHYWILLLDTFWELGLYLKWRGDTHRHHMMHGVDIAVTHVDPNGLKGEAILLP